MIVCLFVCITHTSLYALIWSNPNGVKIRAAIPYTHSAEKNLRSHLGLLTRYFFFNLPCIFKVCQKRKKGEKGREVNVAFCVIWQNLRPYFKYCYIKAEILNLLSDRLPYFHSFCSILSEFVAIETLGIV